MTTIMTCQSVFFSLPSSPCLPFDTLQPAKWSLLLLSNVLTDNCLYMNLLAFSHQYTQPECNVLVWKMASPLQSWQEVLLGQLIVLQWTWRLKFGRFGIQVRHTKMSKTDILRNIFASYVFWHLHFWNHKCQICGASSVTVSHPSHQVFLFLSSQQLFTTLYHGHFCGKFNFLLAKTDLCLKF